MAVVYCELFKFGEVALPEGGELDNKTWRRSDLYSKKINPLSSLLQKSLRNSTPFITAQPPDTDTTKANTAKHLQREISTPYPAEPIVMAVINMPNCLTTSPPVSTETKQLQDWSWENGKVAWVLASSPLNTCAPLLFSNAKYEMWGRQGRQTAGCDLQGNLITTW